jgi:hypothetical protein
MIASATKLNNYNTRNYKDSSVHYVLVKIKRRKGRSWSDIKTNSHKQDF